MELLMGATDNSGTGLTIRCLTCLNQVEHNPRQLQGCHCDPDAPHWCYIEKDGTARGWSQARWEVISHANG
jgi:hypothetical protein